jgi:hypothetical protein
MTNKLQQLIDESKGKFFSITFVKKDGTVRTINGKNRYNAKLAGGERKGTAVPFFNRNKNSWASTHPESIVTFKCGNLVHEFKQ